MNSKLNNDLDQDQKTIKYSSFYVCILWRSTKIKEDLFKKIISESKSFKIAYENHAKLTKSSVKKVLYRMYDYFIERPWAQQISYLSDSTYYIAIIKSLEHEEDDWILTQGGVIKGNRKLLSLKSKFRSLQNEGWLSLHTSMNADEATRDAYTHLGIHLSNANSFSSLPLLSQPPMPGEYSTELEFFEAVKSYPKCCLIFLSAEAILNGSRDIWGNILFLLVDDPKNAANFFGIESNLVNIGNQKKKIFLIGIHSKFICPVWANNVLDTAILTSNGLPVPLPIHHFFSLIFIIEQHLGRIGAKEERMLSSIISRDNIFGENEKLTLTRDDLNRVLLNFIHSCGYSNISKTFNKN